MIQEVCCCCCCFFVFCFFDNFREFTSVFLNCRISMSQIDVPRTDFGGHKRGMNEKSHTLISDEFQAIWVQALRGEFSLSTPAITFFFRCTSNLMPNEALTRDICVNEAECWKIAWNAGTQSRTQSLLTSYGACSTKTKGSGKDRF